MMLIVLGGACALDDRVASVAPSLAGARGSGTTADQPLSPVGAAAGAGASGVEPSSGVALGGNSGAVAPSDAEAPAGSGAGGAPANAASGSPGQGAGGSAAPEPELIGGCFNQLIANAGFEFGVEAWREIADTRDVVVHRSNPELVQAGVSPQAGDYLAWLGGVPNGEYGQKYASTLIQEVTIPNDALSLTLSGYAWVSQSELGLTPSDWAVLELLDPLVAEGPGALWQAHLWNELDAGPGWVYFEAETILVESFRGRTLPLVVDSRPDGNGTLDLWLDSLRLEARCPR